MIADGVGIKPNKHYTKQFKDIPCEEKIQTKTQSAVLKSAKKFEYQKYYEIFNEAAQNGDTFALDEFPSFDIFQDKFLHARTLFIIESGRDVLGVAVMGPSHLCRGHDPNLALIYIYILPCHRGTGLGEAVLSQLESLAKAYKFTGILSDIFVTPTTPYRFLKTWGYTWVGTLRNSGFIQGQGISDCAMFYKDFQSPFQIPSHI